MPKNKKRVPKLSHNRRLEKKMEAIQRLNPFVTGYIQKLEAENEKMKTDPESAIGQIIPQLREALSQNKRLSVLSAALIEAQGGSVKLTKAELETYESKVLSIKWTLPEGVEKLEEAEEFIFTYEALTQEEAQAKTAQVTVTSNDSEPTTVEIDGDEGIGAEAPIEPDAEPVDDMELEEGDVEEAPEEAPESLS